MVHTIYNLVCYSLTFYTRFVHSVLLATIFINQEGKRVRRTELAKKSYIHKFRYSFIYKDCDVDNVFWHAIYNNWQNSVTTINNDKIAYRMPFLLFVVSLHSTSQNIHTISEYTHFRRAAILFRCLAYHPGWLHFAIIRLAEVVFGPIYRIFYYLIPIYSIYLCWQ